jgi:hypothetical protein
MDLALRPMSTSQVLDRTFFLYRNNFVLFAGIAIITPALRLIAMLAQLRISGPLEIPQQPEALTPQFLQALVVRLAIMMVVGTVIYVLGTALASSATAYAVSMVHLGKTTTIVESYKHVGPIFGRILGLLCTVLAITFAPLFLVEGLMLVLLFSMPFLLKSSDPSLVAVVFLAGALVGLALMCGAVVWLFIAICRYALAIPACTLERLPVRQSIRRSKFLTAGAKGGIFGIVILTGLMTIILTLVLQLPASIASGGSLYTGKTPLTMAAAIWTYIAEFLGAALAGPIATVALALVYYDQRVRKEAFDLQILMEAVGQQPQQQAAAAAAPPPPAIG